MTELYKFAIGKVGDQYKVEIYVNGQLHDERLWPNEVAALYWISNTLRTSEPFISAEQRAREGTVHD